MARFAHFSRHALMRVVQRTKLNHFAIADILDYGAAIDIGTELVFDRKHWLFYSIVDNSHYVAVQDSLTGLVITVLPLEYHENIAWKVSEEKISEAKNLSCNFISSKPDYITHPSVVIIKARYMCPEGYQKTVTLTKLRASDYKEDLVKVLSDHSFTSEIRYHSRMKNIDESKIFQITLALGNYGEPIIINWNVDKLVG